MVLTPEERTEFNTLKLEIENIKKDVGKVSYPMDSLSKSSVRKFLSEVLPDFVFDILWDKVFFITNFYASIDGFTQSIQGNGSIVNLGNGLLLSSDTDANSQTKISLSPLDQKVLRWNREQRFRTDLLIPTGADTNLLARISIGFAEDTDAGIRSHFGFRITGETIEGTCAEGTSETKVTLVSSITAPATFQLEAKYTPNESVVFVVGDSNDDFSERGIIRNNLPVSDTSGNTQHLEFLEIWVRTLNTTAHTIRVKFFEFIQVR